MIKKYKCRILFLLAELSLANFGLNNAIFAQTFHTQQNRQEIAKQLGWVEAPEHRCGGYYLESPLLATQELKEANNIHIKSSQYSISKYGTSILEGKVTINYVSRQINANKAYLYRDPVTSKFSAIDLQDALHLREPNTLIIAEKGHINLITKTNSLTNLLYRTAIYGNFKLNSNYPLTTPVSSLNALKDLDRPHRVKQLSAWGQAKSYHQTQPKHYHFDEVSYSTCPPTHRFWQVKASHLDLDKESGRGGAKNARLLIKGIPIFYTPYISFPLDTRRKTGFLWPTLGSLNRNNSYSGYYLGLPFYWNFAPNYDTTITPTLFTERGLQIADLFRYLTPNSNGRIQFSIFPQDLYFSTFKDKQQQIYLAYLPTYSATELPYKQAELQRLLDKNNVRSSFSWQHETRFNEHWSTHIDYSYVSDDYFLEDFSKNLKENTQNSLAQQGELNYVSEHWNFTGRVQSYQTLHPFDVDSVFNNQYSRLPQLLLSGDYPDQWANIHYFINNEATHFNYHNTPGDNSKYPIGQRLHLQPGLELPLNWPFFYFYPRMQMALSGYQLSHVDNLTPKHQNRGLPIFDLSSGLYFDRNLHLFDHLYQQTLEPQLYYVYVPFRNQAQIPIFDTTVNTLTYDQLFVYNRFSSIDRINDANRISLGITTRFINQETGHEHLRAGIGEIIYFKNRAVTLCQSPAGPNGCTDYPESDDNKRRLSPISALIDYTMAEHWSLTANAIWNPPIREQNGKKLPLFDNQTITLHYKRDHERVINLGFSYVRNADPFAGIITNANSNIAGIGNQNNLKLTDFSISWPMMENWGIVGRWSEDWNTLHFQNLFYGLQYDSCCWAAQFVAGKAFTGINNTRPQYTSQFYFQVNLKGLGSFNPKGNPTAALRNNISGYESQFGQDI